MRDTAGYVPSHFCNAEMCQILNSCSGHQTMETFRNPLTVCIMCHC
jgi:hypothetical protein